MWLGSARRVKFLELYRSTRKEYCIYVLHIPEDSVCKIGRSSRMSFRIRNLRASIYKKHTIHIIRCSGAEESLHLDRYLKKTLKAHHRIGEFYDISPEKIEQILDVSPLIIYVFHLRMTPTHHYSNLI